MNTITTFDIQSLIEQDINIDIIMNKVKEFMELEYPGFYDWFNDKVIPGLDDGTRNIVVMMKNDKVIGIANLKKTEKEKKMSNLTVKSFLHHEKYWNEIVNKSLDWLETDQPVVIIAKKEIYKSIELMFERGWYLTDRAKNNDYIVNRYDELECILQNIKRKKANR